MENADKKVVKGAITPPDKNQLDSLKKELKATSILAAERLTQLQYLQADFDNLRKQCAKEKAEYIKCANENIIVDLLSFLDGFEKALEVEKSEGLKNLYQQFCTILKQHGLKKIDAVGKKFDPYLHEVLIKEKSEKEEGTILEELQQGYLLNSKVIRPSKVKISGGNNDG